MCTYTKFSSIFAERLVPIQRRQYACHVYDIWLVCFADVLHECVYCGTFNNFCLTNPTCPLDFTHDLKKNTRPMNNLLFGLYTRSPGPLPIFGMALPKRPLF